MSNFLQIWAESTWQMLVDSAFLLVIGLLLAGLLSLILNADRIKKKITGNSKADVFKAALLGIPLPLCSCSVLPVARQLRQSGVSKGGTVSFLISTPESGVDSIMLTYSLMDPFMTIARPVTALLTATAAGLLEISYETKNQNPQLAENELDSTAQSCCYSNEPVQIPTSNESVIQKLWRGIKYSITDLLSDLAPYLLFGYLLAGIVSAVLGGSLLSLSDTFTSGWGSYLGAIVIGVPLYICATSSTPLAAALLAVGFTPGAVLVFMVVGPATNIASLVVVSKILKGWSIVRYLLVIIIVALICGIITDQLYNYFNLNTNFTAGSSHEHISILDLSSAVILSLFILYYSFKKLAAKFR